MGSSNSNAQESNASTTRLQSVGCTDSAPVSNKKNQKLDDTQASLDADIEKVKKDRKVESQPAGVTILKRPQCVLKEVPFKSEHWDQKLANTERDDIALVGPVKESFNVTFTGDPTCGKTPLIDTLLGREGRTHLGNIDWDKPPYAGTGAEIHNEEWDTSAVILHDTSGSEALSSLRMPVYQMADVLVVCYAMLDVGVNGISYPRSLDNVDSWVNEAKTHGAEGKPIILVGCKHDLYMERQSQGFPTLPTALKHIQEVAKGIGATGFIFTSAKTGFGIEEPDTSIPGEPKLLETMILAASRVCP